MTYVAAQLAAVDDKILDTIGKSKNVEDMKSKLQFFVVGDTAIKRGKDIVEATVPSNLSMTDNKTMQDAYKATKALQKEFNRNPIGVANTVYTCHKMGIRDINHVNQMIDIANESNDVIPKPIRRRGIGYKQIPRVELQRHANTIAPIRSSIAMRFMRNYMNTHNHTDAISQTYGSENDFKQLIECEAIYESIIPYVSIADKPEEIKMNQHDIEKAQIRNYLEHKTVKDAYVDFIERYKEHTKEKIDEFALEIKKDKELDTIHHFYKTNGYEETMAKFGDKLSEYKDPEKFLNAYVPMAMKKCVLTTRNGKPLFANNSLGDIHDELSNMSTKVERENEIIPYDDKERELEATYDAPDGSGKWSFSLHEDTYEMVRTATELSNCLASHHIKLALSKSETLLFMRNELGEKVACISLKRHKDEFRVDEFQAAHDNSVDGRYKDVCLQWLDEHNINYENNSNVASIGKNVSFYGGQNADYHNTEIDEVNNVIVDVERMKDIQKKREALSKSIYGVDENGNILVPEVPEELQ